MGIGCFHVTCARISQSPPSDSATGPAIPEHNGLHEFLFLIFQSLPVQLPSTFHYQHLCPVEAYCPNGPKESKALFLQNDAFLGE